VVREDAGRQIGVKRGQRLERGRAEPKGLSVNAPLAHEHEGRGGANGELEDRKHSVSIPMQEARHRSSRRAR